MSIQFVDNLDSNKVFENIQNRIEDAKLNYFLWKKIEKILEKFEGKQITKRIETEVKKQLPEYTIYYKHDYTMFQLVVWGNGIDYNKNKTFYFGYDSNPYVNMVKIRESNQCHDLEKSRYEKLEQITLKMIEEKCNLWNSGLDQLKSVYQWAGEYKIQYMSYGFDINLR